MLLLGCSREGAPFSVADISWAESFGNHRALIESPSDLEAIHIAIPWRRHDQDPQDRMLLLVSAESGDTIQNIHRLRVNNEWCEILAGPVKAGTYYLYYLPFEVQEGYGNYNKNYLPKESEPDLQWLKKVTSDSTPDAVLTSIEARTEFDNFFPMEVTPFDSEKKAFLEAHPKPYLLFTEDRSNPIRMMNEIPLKWIQDPGLNHFEGLALRNEYYVFQVGLYAATSNVDQIEIQFLPLNGPGGASIGKELLTCFNTEGVDTYGKTFQKEVNVREGRLQPLWIGVDVPPDIKPGIYEGKILMGPAIGDKQEVNVILKIGRKVLADRGDDEPWRHSRLRWLNSTAGLNQNPVAPYAPIQQIEDSLFQLSGKMVTSGANGLPESIRIGETEILYKDITFRMIGETGPEQLTLITTQPPQNYGGIATRKWEYSSENMELSGEGSIESDGYMHYTIRLRATRDIRMNDILLEIPFRKEIGKYMMGMGLPGCAVPDQHQSVWEGPEDSFWVGNTRGGLWVELRGSSYHGPLLNLYHPPPPESWNNHGKGGFRIKSTASQVVATIFSGAREFEKGEELEFEFALLITPVKPLNPISQFRDRYYHNSAIPDPGREDIEAGVKIVNLHHANQFNPFINYPFKTVEKMKSFVERNHARGLKVKLYYTIRELTNHLPEIWALRSLNGEIFANGRGGGYPWLREHLVYGYRPQWYDHSNDTNVDASLLTAPGDSRWINYYIEGLGWLVRNVDIDGLYMDDVTFDRHVMKRIRNVMDQEKPGCIIDLHSNTGFSKGPATQYAEYFPYVDKLWFGESFLYDEMSPENWLVEVSGIPFGHMGDMLHGGGNPWLGMVFGMTTRLPWTTDGILCDPVAIWNIWDEFGIVNSQMSGFWEENPLLETGLRDVKATAYIHQNRVLISVGNFTDESQEVTLKINWDQLELIPGNVHLSGPEIKDFQEHQVYQIGDSILIEPRKGVLLYLEPIP